MDHSIKPAIEAPPTQSAPAVEALRVLLVEHDGAFARQVEAGLDGGHPRAFTVVTRTTLTAALQALAESQFQLFLIDLHLPDCPGLEPFQRLHARSPAVPVIVLVREEAEALALEAIRQGARDYVLKRDCQCSLLRRVIRHVVEREVLSFRLREREEFFQLISSGVTDLIAILDRDGKRLYNSPSYRPLVGDVESLLGTLSFQEVHPDDRELVERAFRETIATGVGRRLEYRFRHKDGTIRFIESQGGVIHDADGRPSKVVVVSRDITERKLAEQAIRDAEQRFRRLLESTTDYIFSVTVQDGRAVATTHSQACLPITGYTAREFDTDEYLWFRIIHPDDRDAVLAQVAQVLKGETPLPLEHRIYHKSGRLRWIRNLLVPHKDLQGQVVAYDGLISNITERKEAELALQASQERLALVIRGSNDGIWDWDVTTSEVYFSPRWKAMLGYEDREIEDKFSSWEHLVHPEDRERARAEVRAYFEGRAPTYELEHRLRHKDGSYRWVLARGVALRDAAGKPLRMAGSHVDLTERKAAEERLQRANAELAQNEEALRRTLAELKAANEELKVTQRQLIVAARLESVGTLAAGVAHEVKNPLQIIVMGLDYVAKNAPPGNQAFGVVLHDMRVAVDRANAIIGEVLKFSADKEFDLQPDDLNAVIDRSLLLTRYELVSHGIALVPELAPALPPVRLNCSKLEQVFVNLFVNAIHAMPNGGALTVRTRVQCPADGTADPEPDEVVVEVQDTGTGIADEHLPRVFDPFFTTKPIGAGTGLGLSVVKKIIDLHGGVIEIRNVAEGGVCVTLRFKARQRST